MKTIMNSGESYCSWASNSDAGASGICVYSKTNPSMISIVMVMVLVLVFTIPIHEIFQCAAKNILRTPVTENLSDSDTSSNPDSTVDSNFTAANLSSRAICEAVVSDSIAEKINAACEMRNRHIQRREMSNPISMSKRQKIIIHAPSHNPTPSPNPTITNHFRNDFTELKADLSYLSVHQGISMSLIVIY
jgi:hypothetical protein